MKFREGDSGICMWRRVESIDQWFRLRAACGLSLVLSLGFMHCGTALGFAAGGGAGGGLDSGAGLSLPLLLLTSGVVAAGAGSGNGEDDENGGDSAGDSVTPITGRVKSFQKLSYDTMGGLAFRPSNADSYGAGVAAPGDINNDGIVDLLVGVPDEDLGGPLGTTDRGAVHLAFLQVDGTIQADSLLPHPTNTDVDKYGTSVTAYDDLDNDGVMDIVVGVPLEDTGLEINTGGFYTTFLNNNGTVKSEQLVNENSLGALSISEFDEFGTAVTAIGDLDNDGVEDLAVGAPDDDDGGANDAANRGAVYILFMNADGRPRDVQKISDLFGGFLGTFVNQGTFGRAVAGTGDLDGDGVEDLAVCGAGDIFMLFLNTDGTVKSFQENDTTRNEEADQ